MTTTGPLYTETLLGVRAWNVSATTQLGTPQGYGDAAGQPMGIHGSGLRSEDRFLGAEPPGKSTVRAVHCGLYAAPSSGRFHHRLEHAFRGEFGVSDFPAVETIPV